MKAMEKWLGYLAESESLLFLKGAIVFLIGPMDEKLTALLVVFVVDLALGTNAARRLKVFGWGELVLKLQKKMLVYGCWIVFFNAIDKALGLPSSGRNAIIFVLIGMEFVSAAKNTGKLGHGRLAKILEGIYLNFMQGAGIPMDEILEERKNQESDEEKDQKDEGGKRGGES